MGLLSSCGIYKPSDARKVSPNADERVKKNLEEGKGFSMMGAIGGRGSGTNYQFASSNPLWRATLEILDFLPLSNIDYSGGIIITDWYNEGTASNESIKITVRFLSNEIRADGIKIIVHKKVCNQTQKCTTKKIKSSLEEEVKNAILRKAVLLDREISAKNTKEYQKKYGKNLKGQRKNIGN
jgi:hypothetical protein